MEITAGTLVDDRYELIACLGDGAMGQVWRAQDTRFEHRSVAVKFLREDEAHGQDAVRREWLVGHLDRQSATAPLTVELAVGALASALRGSDVEKLQARVAPTLQAGQVTAAAIVQMFDELSSDPAFSESARVRANLRRLFRNEANAVANLRHETIVSISDYGEYRATPYLVMDYIEGRTLQRVIEERLPLSLARKLRLLEDLCAGLSFAHTRRLVHRDIKPANLIIDSPTERLKILDFGVVRRVGSESSVGIPVGTFCYMSPEQTRGAATLDHRSDIFAVGVVAYELLTRQKAFPPGRNLVDLVARIQREPPAPIRSLAPEIPEGLEQTIDKAIAKRPEDRYQDLRDMERDIRRIRTELEEAEAAERTRVLKPSDVQATMVMPRGASPGEVSPPLKVPVFAPPPPEPPAPAITPPSAPSQPGTAAPLDSSEHATTAPPPSSAAPPPPATVPASGSRPPTAPASILAPSTRQAVSPRVLASIVGVVFVGALIIIAALWWQTPSRDAQPDAASTSAAAADDTSSPDAEDAGVQIAEPPVAPTALMLVTIDVRPWARVGITPVAAEGQPASTAPITPRYTPFTVELPPGEYTLECENGGLTRPATFRLRVADDDARPLYFTRTMPGFNPTDIVDTLLTDR